MPKQRLALEQGGEPRLELEWGGYMKNFRIHFDGVEIGRIDGGTGELKDGRDFKLPDGSDLHIQLKQTRLTDELQVLRNGAPLPGSASNPSVKLSAGIRNSFFWGILSIIAGAVVLIAQPPILYQLNFSRWSILAGVLMIGCAVWMARRAPLAVVAASAVLITDFLLGFAEAQTAGVSYNLLTTIGFLTRFMVLVPIFQSARVMRTPNQ